MSVTAMIAAVVPASLHANAVSSWAAAAVPGDSRLSYVDRGRAVLNDYGSCILFHHRLEALKFVKTSPDSPEARKAGAELATTDCLEAGTLGFSTSLLRGALFNALYVRSFGWRSADMIIVSASDESWLFSRDQRFGVLQRLAECAVTLDPSDSRAIVIARVGSPAEQAAYAALSSHLGDCIAPGAKISFDKASLGGLLAEALYRMSALKPEAAR